MSYTDQATLELAFGTVEILQLTDRTKAGSVNTDVLARAIASADALIDGYLRAAGYTLPLTEPYPQVIVDIANALARASLYAHKKPEAVTEEVKRVMAALRDIKRGDLKPFADAPEPPTPQGTLSASAPDAIYTDDTFEGY